MSKQCIQVVIVSSWYLYKGAGKTCHSFKTSSTLSVMTQDLDAGIYAGSVVSQGNFCSLGGGQKRYAALEVANTLFRVTFRLKNLRLADSIMKGVSHNLSPDSVTPFNNFPMSQQVTYKFFEGRIAIFNELYVSSSAKPRELLDILCCMVPVNTNGTGQLQEDLR